MEKTVIVINGKGGCGKDTLVEETGKRYRVLNHSAIDPTKEVAKRMGWQGEKTEEARKMLSDLKAVMVRYNDYPTKYLKMRYDEFLQSNCDILFVHIREPEEIEKFVKAVNGDCTTLLIKRKETEGKTYGNASDDGVTNYEYDVEYWNDKPLEEAGGDFVKFLEDEVLPMKEAGEER